MAYTLSNGDIVEVRVNYLQAGQRLLNVFHYRMVGDGVLDEGLTDLSEVGQAVRDGVDQWFEEWKDQASADCVMTSIDTQKIFPTRYAFVRTLVNEPGLSISPPLPQNVQLSLTKTGESTGRNSIGRVEIPGITAALTENGLITAAGATWLEALAPVVLSRIEGPFPPDVYLQPIIFNRTAPGTSIDVMGVRVQDTVRVARRRTVRVGK